MGNPKKFKRLCTESYWNTIKKAGGNKGKQMQIKQVNNRLLIMVKEKENITFSFLCINLRKDR